MDSFAKVCPKCGTRYDAAAAFCQRDGSMLTLTEERPDPRIGEVVLDQFRIEERIGQGGMGAVYRARQTTLARDVAIKVLHPDLCSNPDAVRRFEREARISTVLDHPNVVRVFLFGTLPDGSLYIVMELLRGRTLSELLRVEPQLPVHRALHIATQVADGVGEAHQHGIVHRDVKPENVMLMQKGRDPDFTKVLDFGIARLLRNEGGDPTVATQSGLVFGTARYISPEGAAGEQTDARSDVYSLGVLTYQLLCGETPFDGPSPVPLLMSHVHDTPPHLKTRARGGHVPDAIADVVMRSLSKNPEGRYEDAHEFAEVLRGAALRAGLDVRVRAGSASISSSGERRDPSGPAILPGTGRASSVPRTMMMPEDARPSEVPSATAGYGGDTASIRVPGLRGPSRPNFGSAAWVGAAFLIGALIFGGTAYGVHELMRDPSADQALQIERRARAALDADHLDSPPTENVRELTELWLELRPESAAALTLRRQAASRLRRQGEAALEVDDRELAAGFLRRAMAFGTGDEALPDLLARAEEPPPPPRVASVGVSADPVHGEPALLIATVADGVELRDSDRPRFVVRRGGRRVGRRVDAHPGAEPGTYSASYTFPSAGLYVLEFHAAAGARVVRLETEVQVGLGRRPGTRPSLEPPTTTQGSFAPLPTPAPGPGTPTQALAAAPAAQPVGAVTPQTPPPAAPLPPILPLAPRPTAPAPGDQPRTDPPPPPSPWTSQ